MTIQEYQKQMLNRFDEIDWNVKKFKKMEITEIEFWTHIENIVKVKNKLVEDNIPKI